MRCYVASGLENATEARTIAEELQADGWEITYQWWTHGNVQSEAKERIQEVALNECVGVMTADVLIVVLPGGRGTHTELGIALGLGKPVVLYAKSQWALMGSQGGYCAFYMHPKVEITLDRNMILSMAKAALAR